MCENRGGWLVAWGFVGEWPFVLPLCGFSLSLFCYTEKASPTRHRPERQHNARSNRRKQCRPKRNQTMLQADTPAQKVNYSYKRSHPTPLEADAHTSHVHKNAPAHAQAGDHRVPARTERHNPPRLRAQRQSGLPPRAARSQGQWHRCRSIRKQIV